MNGSVIVALRYDEFISLETDNNYAMRISPAVVRSNNISDTNACLIRRINLTERSLLSKCHVTHNAGKGRTCTQPISRKIYRIPYLFALLPFIGDIIAKGISFNKISFLCQNPALCLCIILRRSIRKLDQHVDRIVIRYRRRPNCRYLTRRRRRTGR